MTDERYVKVTDLVSVAEICRELGVPRTNIHRWAERREATRFPEPVHKSNPKFHVYDMAEVREWHRAWTATRRPHDLAGTRRG